MARRIAIESWSRSRHQLAVRYRADDLGFSTTLWYEDVDLPALERRYGRAFMEWVYFHIAAFDANKLVSLAPEEFDLGPFAHLHTRSFEQLWREIVVRVWAQWRYENDRPRYRGPQFINQTATSPAVSPVAIDGGEVELLAFCGGGKDSLVTAALLEGAGARYSTFAYASSIYGRGEPQHQLIDRLVDTCAPVQRHRLWAYDDFIDSPVVRLEGDGVVSLTAAETPASIFAALPVLLSSGYRHLVLGHEASANVGNLVWEATGEDVNHQWGKSLEAERLLNEYLQQHLVSNGSYFSALQPLFDPIIFYLLRQNLGALPFTHSCNEHKPWCMRCAKCAYVWLGYQAYLPTNELAIPGDNPLDIADNARWYRAMVGLDDHTPFECIGQIDESRLALALLAAKGITGAAIDGLLAQLPPLDLEAIESKYLTVQAQGALAPIHQALAPQMETAAAELRRYVRGLLG